MKKVHCINTLNYTLSPTMGSAPIEVNLYMFNTLHTGKKIFKKYVLMENFTPFTEKKLRTYLCNERILLSAYFCFYRIGESNISIIEKLKFSTEKS